MSDFLSILPLIEALERSSTSARLTCSGPEFQYELWLDSGNLVHWESEPAAEPDQLLAAVTTSIWMRSFQVSDFKAANEPIKLYELVKKSHDFTNESDVPPKPPAPSIADVVTDTNNTFSPEDAMTAIVRPRPEKQTLQTTSQLPHAKFNLDPKDLDMEQTIRLNDHLNEEVEAPSEPAGQIPPKPAPPVSPSTIATQSVSLPHKPPKMRESEFIDKADGNIILFTKGKKERRVAGRAEDCDLVIKDSSTSRNHCELFFDGTLIHVKDLNSSNGTFLNHKQVHIAVAEDGDVLEVGDTQFTLKINKALVPGLV